MALEHAQIPVCLNCGEPLQGSFCYRCGQRHQEGSLAIKHMFKEVIHDIWHFDAKVLQTARLLITRPGFLTTEYLSGKRVRHVPPFRLYIFVSFILFSLLAFEKSHEKKEVKQNGSGISMNLSTQEDATQPEIKVPIEREPVPQPENEPKEQSKKSTSSWEHKLDYVTKDPEAFSRHLQHRISQAMFVLLPGFALILTALYWRRKRYFAEHIVFSLHAHTFFFIVFITQWAMGRLPGSWGGCLGATLMLALPIHLGLSLARVYGQGTPKTLLKGALLSASYLLMVGIVLLGAVILTAMEH